jgi:endonuclease-3
VATKKRKPANTSARENDHKKQAAKVEKHLRADYPDAECALDHQTPFQLLISTILSAQCTDERVNLVTKELFRRYRTPDDFARVPIATLEKAIHSTGFFRAKAKNIKACSQDLVEKYDGELPRTLEEMVQLAGVGRKTANVVLGTAFGVPTGVVVDTHVTRLSQRLGLTRHTDAVKIERDLMELLPEDQWIEFSHRMIHHGRQICRARKPLCDECSMESFCPKIGVSAP